ncbi:metallophosphoesterase family protein [Sphingomonas sp. Leaf37]|uniref:metallophosphoesterase family protein n=1 Tax=Sphingomonas sp. Leaf37 TaxID=2876552 RepID=UPI001E37EB33|nr:DNA repair exonuclease [Sphingomonas sp. Leaf37]
MTVVRFLHSSDLHLGKRFGNFTGDLPGRLREARHAVIGKLAAHAREHSVETILLAGDTFDTETPAADVRRQALTEMAHHAPIHWVILPGNHDSLQATELWAQLAREAPDNVVLATTAAPIALAEGAVLLPAPCTTRRPGRDLSEWMDGASTSDGAIRIGLAHGPIQTFSEEGVGTEVIAPDRARRAGLDYLALGDWHGALAIDPRTHYSGSPEQDRFKHDRPGTALLVDIAGAGAVPEVTSLATAGFAWRTLDLHLLAGDDPGTMCDALLPDLRDRRQTLAKVVASGRTGLAARMALESAIARAAPDFAWLDLDMFGLATECAVEDLDQIDRAGALREAADALLVDSTDASKPAADRAVAAAALARLYGYAQQVSR